VADLAIYAREHEPSLSLDLDECVALPNARGPDATNTPVPTVTSQGTSGTAHQDDGEEEEEGDVFFSPKAVESVGTSTTRAPTSSNHQHPLAVHRVRATGGAHPSSSLFVSSWV
jgi:hypothetical protein